MLLRRTLLQTLVLLGLFAGCSDDDAAEPESEGLDDVVFVNEISDEALARLIERMPLDVAAERLEIQSPTPGAELEKATPITFSWNAAGSTGRRDVPEQPSKLPRILRAIETFLSPLGVAHAHGATYNGRAYYLVFSTPGNAQLLRVFTAGKSYTPDAPSWSKLSGASGPITLSITSADFESSLLVSDGGPFVGGTTQFTIR